MLNKFYQHFSTIHKISTDQVRLDKFLTKVVGYSWNSVQGMIREGLIMKEGIKIKDQQYKLVRGDLIEVKSNLTPNPKPLQSPFSQVYQDLLKDKQQSFNLFKQMLLYEDDNYFAINKPYNICAQGGNDVNLNIPNLANNYLAQSGQTNKMFRVMHRLDQSVSGLMFGAKSLSGARKFNKLIELRNNLSKEYICFVYGIPRQLSGVIQTPLVFDEVKKRAKIVNYTKAEYKECATQYQVVQVFENYSLLRVKLIDGRKHQIRAHLSQVLKTPIVFDQLYGFRYDNEDNRRLQALINPKGILLHSWRMSFIDYSKLELNFDQSKILNNDLGRIASNSQDRIFFEATPTLQMTKMLNLTKFEMSQLDN